MRKIVTSILAPALLGFGNVAFADEPVVTREIARAPTVLTDTQMDSIVAGRRDCGGFVCFSTTFQVCTSTGSVCGQSVGGNAGGVAGQTSRPDGYISNGHNIGNGNPNAEFGGAP